MRKLLLLIAAGSLWLFLAAIPALADGGPHQMSRNSGTSTLTSDSCAGCHRAHTAQGPMLIKDPTEQLLCESCHGTAGQGATTNVVDGVQYSLANGTKAVAGALRGGGFVNARIDSANPLRLAYPRDEDSATAGVQAVNSFSSKVPVKATGSASTSAHIKLTGATFTTAPGKAWGNGLQNTGAGPTVTLQCASCHNPHGNGNYRILNPVPEPATVTAGVFTPAATGVAVAEVRTAPTGATEAASTRNYTVQWGKTLADVTAGTYVGGTADPLAGDYWRRLQPYDAVPTWNGIAAAVTNPANYYRGDMPEFIGAPNGGQLTTSSVFRASMTAWCSTCHTRYTTVGRTFPTGQGSYNTDSGDTTYRYVHGTSNTECTNCHVAHGSDAAMTGDGITSLSATYTYPDTTPSNSSRLLKVNNRGTCQQCHDPTGTVPVPITP